MTIRHEAGSKTVLVDQRPKPTVEGLFVRVGKFRFAAGSAGSVTISNKGTTGHVIVDAVRFTPVGKAPPKITPGIPAEVQKQLRADGIGYVQAEVPNQGCMIPLSERVYQARRAHQDGAL